MWFVLGLTLCAVVAFARDKWPLEVTSVGILTILLLFGQFFPLLNAQGRNQLDAMTLLSGFANPSLVAVLALLVMGQAVIQTDALRPVSRLFRASSPLFAWISIFAILIFVLGVSAFMNNTPLVILAIPIIQALAAQVKLSESRIMMPLSYAAILGGMMTLVGSSTNLLVSSAMEELGYSPIGFWDFTKPGLVLAAVGFVYVVLIVPRIMPERRSMTEDFVGSEKEFIAEFDVAPSSSLVGMECEEGRFPQLPDLNVRLIQRAGQLILPPFEGYVIEANDILIVAATRDSLAQILSKHPGYLLSEDEADILSKFHSEEEGEEEPRDLDDKELARSRTLAEVMINPGSRLVDMSLEQIGFHRQFKTIILGIQRRARVVRRRLGRIRLEAGDVLLVCGSRTAIEDLRGNQDMIVLSGSKQDLAKVKKAPVAAAIFLFVIALAAAGMMTIPVAAITGAVAMIATGCLNVRQATRAVDRKIFLLVGSMLALGAALKTTNGAGYLAERLLELPFVDTPLALAVVLFIIVAITTNVLTNNACAILFTPIAMNLANEVGIDPMTLAITVIFAANCSFASPIGYQTNLLVMGPGHYRFGDFIKAGVPLILILWVTYIFVAHYYFGLNGLWFK
ncbi:MAG: SLC13 family permease [Alphaproteobacteria bacterium]|jgi:di/tricarboxylate transporter|nr:SLC13 family permease [Alphaproteobacteria bacterium]|tara:strand:+ start:4658 stop:6529 length:1872 start_codon:yes stop_codon:yes gene_type:complete